MLHLTLGPLKSVNNVVHVPIPPHTHAHTHTQPDHFPFLNVAHSNLDLGCRTLFYVALARLLLVELGESEEKFERFISPLNCKCGCAWVGTIPLRY